MLDGTESTQKLVIKMFLTSLNFECVSLNTIHL